MTTTDAQTLIENYEAAQKSLHDHLLPLLKDYTLLRHELYGTVDPNLIKDIDSAVFFSTGYKDYTFIIEDYEDRHGEYTEFYPVYLLHEFANDPEGYKATERKKREAYKTSQEAQARLKAGNRVKMLKAELAKEEAKLSGSA